MKTSAYLVSLLAAILAVMTAPAVAAADPPLPDAGMISQRNTACARLQYRGPKCEPPALPNETSGAGRLDAHLKRALFYIDIYDLPLATAEAEEAVRLDPARADALHLLARLKMSRADHVGSEKALKAALALRPSDPDILATRADWLQMHRRPEALRLFSDIVATHPDHRFSREARARLLLELGEPDQAIADYDHLLKDSRDPRLYGLRAMARMAGNKPEKAVADFTEALKNSPHSFSLLTGRAAANEMIGNDAAALLDYEAILGPVGGQPNIIMPGDALAKYHNQRARIFLRQKRFQDAAGEAGQAINLGGRRAILRAQIYLRSNGFPDLKLNGADTPALRASLQACFALNSCQERIHDAL